MGESRGGRQDPDVSEEQALRAQAQRYRRLTPAEESDLLGRRPGGEATEKLVQHNLDLVVEEAEAHANQGLAFPDLYQEGALGLLDAVVAYDGRGGFRKFANLHVGLQMDALLAVEAGARQQDEEVVTDARRLDLAQAMFRHEHGKDATEDELASVLGWDVTRLKRVAHALDLARERYDENLVEFLDDDDDE